MCYCYQLTNYRAKGLANNYLSLFGRFAGKIRKIQLERDFSLSVTRRVFSWQMVQPFQQRIARNRFLQGKKIKNKKKLTLFRKIV